ncbi:hypothetical protein DSM104635_00882 [Terricaulis silvestris]|uniref:Outer membrane beta-barrel protein n=1 Tax=Terricaulis silvestris TaxID=2686094 RepID=A0A6I6MLI3_9CAUL|nr:hypothetical protein DSM104635_00882 [Terricaulis silvestris]
MTPSKRPVNLVGPAFPAPGASCCDLSHGSGNLRSNPATSRGSGSSFGGGLNVRIYPFVSLFAASLIALLPTHAMAQQLPSENDQQASVSVRDRDREEYRPLGVHLGGFDLNGAIDFGIASTDNLFAAESGTPAEVDDMIYTVAPNARLTSNWSRHMVQVGGGAEWRMHEDFSNEDSDDWYLRAAGRVDVGDSTAINGSARASHETTPRTDPDSPLIGEPVEYDRNTLSAGVTHRFSRMRVSLDAVQDEYDYNNTQNFRDNEETGLRGRLEAELSPRIGLLLRAETDERDYDNTPNLNSEGQSILAGVTLNTDLMRGEIAVGQFERDYDDPTVGTFDGVAIAGSLEWYVTQLTTLTFTARQDADDQISVTAGLPFISTEYGARIDHELRRNIILTAAARFGERDYDAVDRSDEVRAYEVGADYLLNRRVALRARYNYDESQSDGALAGRDYEANRFSLGLSLRL